MAKLQLVSFPHPVLRHKSKPIVRVDAELHDLVNQMFEIMYDFRGVGLAANQVALPIRLFVANPSGDRKEKEQEMVFINPVVNKPKGTVEAEEGCLSLPGINANIIRSKSLEVNAYDLQGNEIAGVVDGFLARIIQHELDHLDGVLFIDRLTEEGQRPLQDDLSKLSRRFDEGRSEGSIPSDDKLAEEISTWEKKYC
ncbi:peptide deformylase [Pirellulaceae bacterium SH449]